MIVTNASSLINTEQLYTPDGKNEVLLEEMEKDNDDNITPQGSATILQTDLKLENYAKTLIEENAKIREENANIREENANIREENANIREENAKMREENVTILEDKLKVEEEIKKLRQDNLKLQNDFFKFREDMMKMFDVNARPGNNDFVNNN
jgi:hypothetical protein